MAELLKAPRRKVAVRQCKEHAALFEINYRLQTSKPIITAGSEAEEWFKPLLGRFLVIQGFVLDKNVFTKPELYRDRIVELITLATVRLAAADVDPLSPLGVELLPYKPLREQLKVITRNNCELEAPVFLQMLPIQKNEGIQIAHDSVTVSISEIRYRMFQRFLAVLQVIGWSRSNVEQLIDEYSTLGQRVLNCTVYVLQGRKKMTRSKNEYVAEQAIKMHDDFITHMKSTLQSDGISGFTKLIFELQDELLPTKTGEEFIHKLEDDAELMGFILSNGPFLLTRDVDLPLWDA